MITGVIRSILSADDAVTELVADRVFHQQAAQDIRQAHAVITKISSERPRTMDGQAHYTRGTVAIECFAPEIQELKTLTAAIINATDNQAGNIAGLNVSYLQLVSERDQPARPAGGQGLGFYSTELQFQYMHNNP